MSQAITAFFKRQNSDERKSEVEKRKKESTSSESDASPTGKPSKKKACTTSEESEDMSLKEATEMLQRLQEAVSAIEVRLGQNATAEDVRALGARFEQRLEKMEAQIFDMAHEIDGLKTTLGAAKQENQALRDQNSALKHRLAKVEGQQNDAEQYDRRWNLRVFNVPESSGETADDCVRSCCDIFSDLVGVQTKEEDLEAAHRVGKPGVSVNGRPRPIIVRFSNRRVRDRVLADRKKLKGKKISIGEDLTMANYKLEREAFNHSASSATWSVNGKIFAKLKNGQTVQIRYGDNVNAIFVKAMS